MSGGLSGGAGMERIDPAILEAVTLDDLAVTMRRLLALMERQMPTGATPFLTLTATTTRRELSFQPPWFSIDFFNDGPGVLLCSINNASRNPIRIHAGEDHRFDYQAPVIRSVFVSAEAADVAVRLEGTF